MSEILRDPMWQFVGVLVTIIIGVISLIIVSAERRKKVLSYEIISSTSLISVRQEIRDKLKIVYQGKIISQLYLNLIKIINSGNLPITASDFAVPVTFVFKNGTEIITAEVSGKKPAGLEATVAYTDTQVVLKPTLLNSGDSVEIKVLSTGQGDVTSVNGRIIGVKEIKKVSSHGRLYMSMAIAGLLLFTVGELMGIYDLSLGWLLFILGVFLFFYGFLKSRLKLKVSS